MEGHDFRHFTRPQADIVLDPAAGAPVTHALMHIEALDADFPPRQAAPAQPVINQTDRNGDYRRYFTSNARKLAMPASNVTLRCSVMGFAR